MKGRFNLNMTEYYIEGENIQELGYVQTVYDPWLEEHGFQFKQYCAIPLKGTFAFMVTYNVPGIILD